MYILVETLNSMLYIEQFRNLQHMVGNIQGDENMKKLGMMILGLFVLMISKAQAQPFPHPLGGVYTRSQSIIFISSYPASATAGTVSISSPTASSTFSNGENVYITGVYITAFASATIAGTSPLQCTSANLNGWTADFSSAYTVGGLQTVYHDYAGPLVSTSPASIVKVTCPAAPALRWNMQLNYYTAP